MESGLQEVQEIYWVTHRSKKLHKYEDKNFIALFAIFFYF